MNPYLVKYTVKYLQIIFLFLQLLQFFFAFLWDILKFFQLYKTLKVYVQLNIITLTKWKQQFATHLCTIRGNHGNPGSSDHFWS